MLPGLVRGSETSRDVHKTIPNKLPCYSPSESKCEFSIRTLILLYMLAKIRNGLPRPFTYSRKHKRM